MIKRILVPVDFSDPSLRALDYAIDFSRPLKSQLIVLHVVEPVYYPMAADMYGVGLDLGNVYESDRTRRARATLPAGWKTPRSARGGPHRALPRHRASGHRGDAKKLKADLIVMSTHGRTGLSHLLMGSVAERVVRTAACPVLIVPGRRSTTSKRTRGTRRARPQGTGRTRSR